MQALELAEYLVAHGQFTTVAEAVSVLNLIFVEEVGASGVINTVTGGAAATVIGGAGQSALDVATTADLVAKAVESRSAAISLMADGVKAKAAAVLGVEYGVVAASIAPLLGIGIGDLMYRSNPSLWTKISQTLLPFCYEGTSRVPVYAYINEYGNWVTSIPERVMNALRNLFNVEVPLVPAPSSDTLEAGVYTTGAMSVADVVRTLELAPGASYPDLTPYEDIYGASCWHTQGYPSPAGSAPYGGVGEITIYDDGSVTISGYVIGARFGPAGVTNITISHNASTASRGGYEHVSAGEDPYFPGERDYQEGTVLWPYTGTPSPGLEHITRYDPIEGTTEVETTYPISITPTANPTIEGWPSPSQNPEEYPDPTTTTVPSLQIDPYIQPTQDPTEVASPTIYPYPQEDPTKPRDPDRVINDTIDPPTPTITDVIPIPSGVVPDPPMPSTPSPFSSVVGMVSVYHPTAAQLYAFEQWLWVTYQDATIDKIWNNPFDGVISLFELYCTPTDNGYRNIHCGFLDSGINSALVSRYTEIDCGTLGIPEFYGNYLDYSPYSKAHIYLPFIGIQELNVDDIVGHAVNVKYRIDEYNGSCIAMITVAKVTTVGEEEIEYSNIMYQFSGNCAVELPLSGGSQAAIKAGMMQADAYQYASNVSVGASLIGGVASAVGGLLMGALGMGLNGANQIANAATQYASGKANYLSNMLSGKSTVQKSGTFGSSHGALGVKKPFITITRPKQVAVPNYEELYGFPAHKMVTIGACTGFLRCKEVHVISPTATDQEKSMIEAMLKSGVYVTE